ncbi:MAG: hypothetical protein VKL39_08770, partial [Leptolyngbyaceae bacterium]|nr:hypothetical protein [Leptolyngbyaceae bacterium]
MQKLRPSRAVLMVLAGAIATLSGGGCGLLANGSADPTSSDTPALSVEQPVEQTSPSEPSATIAPSASPQASESPATNTPQQTAAAPNDTYPDAINRASSAFNLSQSAQSQDDWLLVSNRWQQAIELMASVPSSSPNHADAQQKLTEYRRNLSYAREQAALPVPTESSTVISIDIDPESAPSPSSSSPSQPSRSSNRSSNQQTAGLPQTGGGVFRAPIVRRAGGTPVVMVTFNGNQTFEMIVDTGASGTVITQP